MVNTSEDLRLEISRGIKWSRKFVKISERSFNYFDFHRLWNTTVSAATLAIVTADNRVIHTAVLEKVTLRRLGGYDIH